MTEIKITAYSILLLVYVDSSDMCNEMAFNLAATGSTVTRAWTIKVRNHLFFSLEDHFIPFISRLPNMTVIMTTWLLMAVLNISGAKQLTL